MQGKRLIFPILPLLILCICCFSCGSQGDRARTIYIYSPHGPELLGDMETAFESVHPDYDVQWLFMGSQAVLDRLRSERANPQCDLWWGAPSTMFRHADAENLLQPYKPSWADAVLPDYKSENHTWYGNYLTPQVIGFNSRILTNETAPKEWDDLLQPAWKDKIIIRDPLASGTMRVIFMSMIFEQYRTSGTPEAGFEWLKQLDANTKAYAANPTIMYQKLAREEGLVTLWNQPDMELQAHENGYPFGYNVPSVTPVTTDGIAIPAGAKNAEGAQLFYEFVTTVDQYVYQAERYYRIPARTDIPPTRLPAWMREKSYQPMAIDWNLFTEKEQEWLKHWEAHIKYHQ